MKMLTMILAIAALAFLGAGIAQAQVEWGDKPQEQKPEGETAPADGKTEDKPVQTEETRRVDQTLGIDWGDDKDKTKPEDPNARQPGTKVDLKTALEEGQQKRLAIIQKLAAEGDELAELAKKTRAGENKNMPKERCVAQYNLASTKYLKASTDLEKFAKPIRDEDTRLTLLREYGDDYRKKAINMLNEAGHATLEMQNNLPGIRTAVGYFKRARDIDESDAGWRTGYMAAQSAMLALVETAKTATPSGGGISEKEETYIESKRERDEMIRPGQRPDYKRGER